MNNVKNLIWIASYPKSGNTWLRSILTSLIYTENGLFDFKLLPKIDQFEKKNNFKFVKDFNKTDFNNLDKMEIVSKYWQEAPARNMSKNVIFYKTHSSNYNYKIRLFYFQNARIKNVTHRIVI